MTLFHLLSLLILNSFGLSLMALFSQQSLCLLPWLRSKPIPCQSGLIQPFVIVCTLFILLGSDTSSTNPQVIFFASPQLSVCYSLLSLMLVLLLRPTRLVTLLSIKIMRFIVTSAIFLAKLTYLLWCFMTTLWLTIQGTLPIFLISFSNQFLATLLSLLLYQLHTFPPIVFAQLIFPFMTPLSLSALSTLRLKRLWVVMVSLLLF